MSTISEHRKADDGRVGQLGMDESRCVESVYAGHAEVHQNYIRPRLASQHRGRITVSGFPDDVDIVLAAEGVYDSLAESSVVINYEDSNFGLAIFDCIRT